MNRKLQDKSFSHSNAQEEEEEEEKSSSPPPDRLMLFLNRGSEEAVQAPREEQELVPVKRDEEEYFPGTRQPKKNKRKPPRKYQTVKLSDLPGPLPQAPSNIPPAGAFPAQNAWSQNKGSNLFANVKSIKLKVYGPQDNTNAICQRAMEEAPETQQQGRDRTVNMFASPGDQEREAKRSLPSDH